MPSIAYTQSDVNHKITIIKTYPDGEYVLDIDGRQHVTLSAEQAKQIEHDRNALDAATKTVALQADLIASLQRQVSLDAKLDALATSVRHLQDDQIARLLAVIGKLDALQANSDEIKGGMARKSKLDAFPVKFGFTALGGAANVRDLLRPNPQTFPKGSIITIPSK